jgi:hypothetical protein
MGADFICIACPNHIFTRRFEPAQDHVESRHFASTSATLVPFVTLKQHIDFDNI